MKRKAVSDGGKYDAIVSAASECFFTKGYDGTSVRAVMKKAGAEVGLFYYYFDNKDEVFEKVLDNFFSYYQKGFAAVVEQGRRNPCRIMENFFNYMGMEIVVFRKKYAENMHRTVRWAIREHTLEIIEPYIRDVIRVQSEYYDVKPPLEPEIAAIYLTHGVGSAMLHEDEATFMKNRQEIKRGVSLIMGMPMEDQELRIPYPAVTEDIPGWMKLVESTRYSFPGMNTGDHEKELTVRIENHEAWVFRDEGRILAAMLYSKNNGSIDFLAVDHDHRRNGFAAKLIETAAAQMPVGTELSVVTYRENDIGGKAAVAFYRALGFMPGEEFTLFNYPCQKYTVTVPDGPLGKKLR